VTTPDFGAEFIDEYFAECDEHLVAVRHALLTVESTLASGRVDPAAIEQLFRSMHSIKGLSGMVELRDAELLAHELESRLRDLRDGNARWSPAALDALALAMRTLEAVIGARREQRLGPDITPAVSRLRTPDASSAAHDDAGGPRAAASSHARPAPHRRRWRFTYAPTADTAGRHVNVNVIRERLLGIGEIEQATPHVPPGGGIVFEFVVATDADTSVFAPWVDDGVTWDTVDDAPAQPSVEVAAHAAASAVAPSHLVRVDLARLDDLMRIVGGLVITRARLSDHLGRLEPRLAASEWRGVQESVGALERQLRDLREAVMRVRMVPVGEVFHRMRFVVRDLAREAGRHVHMEMQGEGTHIDKFVIERMLDPLLHLVRNAVSHGLEPAAERRAKGKPEEGRLALRASTAGDVVVIVVEDDGRGVNRAAVVESARAGGLAVPEGPIDDAQLLELICSPGFSTRKEADLASGRGVGMAVVRRTVLEMGGSLMLETEPDRGTRFTIQLPLTLAITDALITTVGDRTFAVPQAAVREVMEVEAASVRQLENNEVITYRDGVLPVLRLARAFGLPETARATFHAFVIGQGASRVAVLVDRIVGQREIVVRTFSEALIKVPGVGGATELGDGRVVLILDAGTLVRRGRERSIA
jgi:two-component system chemotaxis sensor kinase CheA